MITLRVPVSVSTECHNRPDARSSSNRVCLAWTVFNSKLSGVILSTIVNFGLSGVSGSIASLFNDRLSLVNERHGKDFLTEVRPPLGSPHQAPQRRLENPGIGDPRKLAYRPTLDFVRQGANRQSKRAVGPDDRDDRLKQLRSALHALSHLPCTLTPHGPVLPSSCRSSRECAYRSGPSGDSSNRYQPIRPCLAAGLHVSTCERVWFPDEMTMQTRLSAVVLQRRGRSMEGKIGTLRNADDRVEVRENARGHRVGRQPAEARSMATPWGLCRSPWPRGLGAART